MSLEEWLSSHSSSPRLFCFDCAFLPEPHELCVVHSLHQQQRDGFGLEGGRRGGGDIVGEGKNEEGPLPVSHSTPQAGIARVDCYKTPELLTPGPKSAHDEMPLSMAWSISMGTPPLPTTVGRTAERRFLLEGNVSMASTDVSTHTHSLLDEEVFLNTKHLPLDNKPDDGTPRRGDIGTSPDRRKLVALFNIRGGQLEGGVCSPTSPPLQLGQPLQPGMEGIVPPEGGSQEGPSQTSKMKCCDSSRLSSCQQTASPSQLAHLTTSPCVCTPLNHEPSLRDSSFADCIIGSQDLFSSSPEPATSPNTLTPDHLPCSGDGRRQESCSLRNTQCEPENKIATVIGLEVECDNVATLLECPDAVPMEDCPCRQEDVNSTPQQTKVALCSPPAHVDASSEVAVAMRESACEDSPMEGGQGSATFCNQEQSSPLCDTASLSSVQTVNPSPVSTSPVAKKAARSRPNAAKFLYSSKRQRTCIKQHSIADSNELSAVSSSASALAQSVLADRKDTEPAGAHLPVDKAHVFQSHRLPAIGDALSDGGGVSVAGNGSVLEESSHHDSPGDLDKEEGETALQLVKEFPVTCNNSLLPGNCALAPQIAGAQMEGINPDHLYEQEHLLHQDNESRVLRGDAGAAGSTAYPVPDEQGKVLASSKVLPVSQDKLGMSANENACKLLPPARKRKRSSRSWWARRRKKRNDEAEVPDEVDAGVCINPAEGSESVSVSTSAKMAKFIVEQTVNSVNEGEEGANLVKLDGSGVEEGAQLETAAMGCIATNSNPKQLDSLEHSFDQDVKLLDQKEQSTMECVECYPAESQHAAKDDADGTEACRAVITPATSGTEDNGASKLLPRRVGSLLRKPLSGRYGSEPRVQQAAVPRKSTGSGFKAPRLAASVPLAEENAARSRILKGFGVRENIPTRPASSLRGAQHLYRASKELLVESDLHTSLEVEGCSVPATVQSDTGRVNTMGTHVKDCSIGVALTGFSTASGARCTVSSNALDRVKPLLMDEDMIVLPGKPSCGSVQNDTGFSTAGGRKCTVTSASLKMAETIVNDTKDEISPSAPIGSMFTGFSTAGGQKCTVSAHALKRAQTLCDDSSVNALSDAPAMSGPPRTMTGFTTASGGACSVSASALNIGQRLCSENAVEVEGDTKAAHTGFSTAGGSRITVSGGAMSRVKHLFTDLMNEGSVSSLEVQPAGISGSMIDSAEDLVPAAANSRGRQECVVGDGVSSTPEVVKDQGQFGEAPANINCEGVVDAKDKFVGNAMDASLVGGQDIEVDLEGIDLENFAAFTQLPQQNASGDTTDAMGLDRSTAASLLATDKQSEIEESHEAIDDTLVAEVATCAVRGKGEDEKENVSTSSTVSLEGSSVYELPSLDTQMVQQMLESTAISNTGADEPSDRKDVAEGDASFNLTISLANLGEGFSQLGADDSVTDDGAVVTCSSPCPTIKMLENAKEADRRASLSPPLLDREQCLSLAQFDVSLGLPAFAEYAQGRAVVDGGGGTADEDREVLREEMVVDAREGVVTEEGGGTTVDEKEVMVMGERNVTDNEVMVEEEVLMEEKGIKMMELEGEAVMNEEKVTTMEGEELSSNEEGWRCTEVTQLAEGFPGLQTSSGKEVKVSRAALDKERSIITPAALLPHHASSTRESQCAVEDTHYKESNSLGTSPKLREKAMFVGLQTASGKCVPISKEAMEHISAQHCQPSVHESGKDWVGTADTRQPTASFRGLQTASGKAVAVSDAALKAVRSLTHEPRASTGVSGVEQEGKIPTDHFVGLQTASGSKVEVAEASLEHVRSSNGGGSSSTALHGFTTAGGKVVSISEDALHHVKSSTGGRLGGSGLPGLQTASGNLVEVSEKSLAHVKAGQGAVLMRGNSLQQATCGLQMGVEEEREVEAASESLQKGQAVPMGSSGSSMLECEQCDQVPPALPLGSGSLTVAESIQQREVAQEVPPSSAKNRSLPLHPAAGVGTSSTLSSVREGDVPSVVKYAPRFKPQASAGSKSTMSRRVVEENKAALAPTALQSPPTVSFKPSYHSTPEAYLTDRHRLKGLPLKPLHSTVMETPTNHQKGQPYGAASTGQRKRFVYSVPPRGCLPTNTGLPRSVQPQPICTKEDGSTSLPSSRMGLTRGHSLNTTPVWPAGLRRPHSHLHGTRASYTAATSLPLERAGVKDSGRKTIAVRLNLDESCSNETLPEASLPCEAMPEGTSPAMVPDSPEHLQERSTKQAQIPQCISNLAPEGLHGEAVDDVDLTDSQLTLFMNMSQLEQPPPIAVSKADSPPFPVSTSDRHQVSKQRERLQSTAEVTSPSCSTVQPTTLSPEADSAMKESRRQSISPPGNVTTFMFEDSGIGTMPSSNNTSIRRISCLAPSPNCTTHPGPYKEECSSAAQPEEAQQRSLHSKKRAGECQSEPRPSKRRKDGHAKPLNNTVMEVTAVGGVRRGCPIRPQGGTLYSIKRSSCRRLQPLALLTRGLPLQRHTEHQLLALGVPSFVLGVSITNAVDFRFEGQLFFSPSVLAGQGVRVGDGAMLHLGGDGCAGACELERAFCTTPGVDPRLVPAHWFRNHYKWLVWKLAAMEVCFPRHFAGRSLTPNWLMTQMKYRYDKEIDNAQRSALRKVYEHDDTPAKTMVLCVCKVNALEKTRMSTANSSEGSTATVDETVVELTDGWYSIPAVFDTVLKYYLGQGTISVGTKLITCGAELTGSGDPCSPLEAPSSVMLKVSANSTRRARWDTKLGFHPHAKPFHIPLYSVRPDGGKVGSTSFTVARVYPLLFMEKRSDGSKAFRTKRAEEKAARASDSRRLRIIEGICERERKKFEKEVQQEDAGFQPFRSRRRLNSKQIMGLDDGEDIYRAMQQVADPLSFQECLSVTQKTLLMSYKETVDAQRRDELQKRISSAIEEAEEEELPPKRDVVHFLKMKVTDTCSDTGRTPSDAVFCVWRPSEDVRQLLKEGCSFRVYSLQASEGRGGLQLTATKFTRYEEVSSGQSGWVATFCPRKVTAISDLTDGGQDHPYGEVDVVGVVIHVSSTVMATARGEVPLDTIYLADQDGNMVTIKVWEGLSALGYDDLVQPCMLLSASNLLQVQHSTGHSALPSLQARDVTVFSQSPRDQHLSEALRHLKGALPAKVKQFCDSLLEYVRF